MDKKAQRGGPLICNQAVAGSIPIASSKKFKGLRFSRNPFLFGQATYRLPLGKKRAFLKRAFGPFDVDKQA